MCEPTGYLNDADAATVGLMENVCAAVSPFFPLTVKLWEINVPYCNVCALAVTVSVGRSR